MSRLQPTCGDSSMQVTASGHDALFANGLRKPMSVSPVVQIKQTKQIKTQITVQAAGPLLELTFLVAYGFSYYHVH